MALSCESTAWSDPEWTVNLCGTGGLISTGSSCLLQVVGRSAGQSMYHRVVHLVACACVCVVSGLPQYSCSCLSHAPNWLAGGRGYTRLGLRERASAQLR
ncbi:hypothetical protein MHYP_G00153100 [Metynnis hypsauchen]